MYLAAEDITIATYDLLKDQMSNMDLIMFRGDDIISDAIADLQGQNQAISGGKGCALFTHAGLVIKSDLLPGYNLDPDKLYLLESTYSHEISGMNNGPPDCLTNEHFFGVQLRDLEKICKTYIRNEKTKIAWFKLKNSPIIHDFVPIFKKYHLRPFLRQEMLPMIDFKRITPETLMATKSIINKMWITMMLKSAFSCVNLITSIYYELGIISCNENISYPMELLTLVKRTSFSPPANQMPEIPSLSLGQRSDNSVKISSDREKISSVRTVRVIYHEEL